jgi:hypothetical protein
VTESGSLANPIDVQNSAEVIAAGGYVAIQYHSVFVMAFSGVNLDARREVMRVKNENDSGKPLSSISFSQYVFPSVDMELVQQPEIRALLSDVRRFQRTMGAMCHLRLPLKSSAVGAEIPEHMTSLKDGTPYVQSLDPSGNLLVANFSREVNDLGVHVMSGSSLNLQGGDEICDLSTAKRFCDERGVPYLLHDPLYARSEVKGSFPVVDLVDGSALRDGHIPMQLIENLLGVALNKTNLQSAEHPHARHLIEMCDQPLMGSRLRESILNYLYGK